MTDEHRFAKTSERSETELWNVSLLPIVEDRGAKLLENLDERRSKAGGQPLREQNASISASFESQPRAVGW